MKRYLAYKILCLVNGKGYIGITSNPINWRWNKHIFDAKASNAILYRAMRKHGVKNFRLMILTEAASVQELLVLERGLIAAHGTYAPAGYNLTTGGEGVWNMRPSLESLKHRSNLMKKKYADPLVREAMSLRGKLRFADPEKKASHQESMKRFANTERFKTISRDRQKKLFQDPAYREKIRAGACAYHAARRLLRTHGIDQSSPVTGSK